MKYAYALPATSSWGLFYHGDMDNLSAFRALCERTQRSMDSPYKGAVLRGFDFVVTLKRIWLSQKAQKQPTNKQNKKGALPCEFRRFNLHVMSL